MLDRNGILDLLSVDRGTPRVSLYMPTHRSGPQTRQDPIRFRNLLNTAESELGSLECGPGETEEILQSVALLHNDTVFWRHQLDGLAVFLAPGFSCVERLPLSTETACRVGDRFYVRPLLPLLGRRSFYVLALSRVGCRLYKEEDESLETVPLACQDESVSSLTPDRRIDGALQYRSASSPASQRQGDSPVYHGQATSDQKEEADLRRFVREVDRCVAEALRNSDGPLILAAVGYVAAAYESVNAYRHLSSRKIPGNPEEWSRNELHRLAREIAAEDEACARAGAASAFLSERGGTRAAEGARVVVPAAVEGRVSTLLVAHDSECRGELDLSNGRATVAVNGEGEDLVELAAASTLLQGGGVVVLDRDRFPSDRAMAAILRYAG